MAAKASLVERAFLMSQVLANMDGSAQTAPHNPGETIPMQDGQRALSRLNTARGIRFGSTHQPAAPGSLLA